MGIGTLFVESVTCRDGVFSLWDKATDGMLANSGTNWTGRTNERWKNRPFVPVVCVCCLRERRRSYQETPGTSGIFSRTIVKMAT